MTPAVNSLKKAGIDFRIHQYEHDADCSAYGDEAAEKLGLDRDRVFKTLVANTDCGELVVAVLPVSVMLDLKLLAREMKAKKAVMTDKSIVERNTGYIVGGVSPLAQKRRLRTIIDSSAEKFKTIFVSGGKRGLDIELSPNDLAMLTNAVFIYISRGSCKSSSLTQKKSKLRKFNIRC